MVFVARVQAEVIFHYRFEAGNISKDEENAHPLTATSGPAGVPNTAFPDPLIQNEASNNGTDRYVFPSGLEIQPGTAYAALVRVRIDPTTGAEVQWSWREIGGTASAVTEVVQTEAHLTAIHNSSARLRVGAVTKAGVAANFWDGRIDEVRMHDQWIEAYTWLDHEGPTGFDVYMDLFYPGVTDVNTVGLTADPDEDGADNEQEYVWGTPPDDPANPGRVRILQDGPDGLRLRFRQLKNLAPESTVALRHRAVLGTVGGLLSVTPWVIPSDPDTPSSHEEVVVFLDVAE